MVVFGWYGITIKSFTREELNNIDVGVDNPTFQVKQKVAHIFWIPIFPVGKQYVIKAKGNSYEMPEALVALINSKEEIKTPWYSFALPILAVVVYVFMSLQTKWHQHQYDKRQEEKFEKELVIFEDKLKAISEYNFLKIINPKQRYSSDHIYLDVIKVKNDTVFCFKVNIDEYSRERRLRFLAEYYDVSSATDTIKIPVKTLSTSYYKDYDTYKFKKSIGSAFLEDENLYYIDKIEYINGFVFNNVKCTRYSNIITINLGSVGEDITLIEIENIGQNIDWKNELPLSSEVKGDGKYTLHGENDKRNESFEIKLTFEDSEKKKHYLLLSGKGYNTIRLDRVFK